MRYTMAQTNSDKFKLFIHLYVYFVSNLLKLCATYLDFVTLSAVRTTSVCLFVWLGTRPKLSFICLLGYLRHVSHI